MNHHAPCQTASKNAENLDIFMIFGTIIIIIYTYATPARTSFHFKSSPAMKNNIIVKSTESNICPESSSRRGVGLIANGAWRAGVKLMCPAKGGGPMPRVQKISPIIFISQKTLT